jgi:hypothetical protein
VHASKYLGLHTPREGKPKAVHAASIVEPLMGCIPERSNGSGEFRCRHPARVVERVLVNPDFFPHERVIPVGAIAAGAVYSISGRHSWRSARDVFYSLEHHP